MLDRLDDRKTAFLDADNTLWDTDGVFAAAQLLLWEEVKHELRVDVPDVDPLAFLRSVDQAIAERHQDGLRYPARLLVRGLERAIAGEPADTAARAVCRGHHRFRIVDSRAEFILETYYRALRALPDLRKGVCEGLRALNEAGVRLLIISEGSKRRVEETAARHGLLSQFERVIEGRKRPELYRRILSASRAVGRAFMIGDQLDRDVLPAKAAGLETIHFPGNFQPRWSLSLPASAADHVVHDFSLVPSIISGDALTEDPNTA
ncbi:HAD family hydrolase [Novosphingobium sp.]|uniref:HAD family hydrolase n=1 Tax=Novosphingobium sp. TaxID=1874826 RepID=UPI0031E00A95